MAPPGSGKETFGQFAKERCYLHLSAGDPVRQEIAEKTAFRFQIEETVKRGDFVDSKVLMELIREKIIAMKASENPFIIDGFGRTKEDFIGFRSQFACLCFVFREPGFYM